MFVPLGPNELKMIFTHQRDEEKCLSCRGPVRKSCWGIWDAQGCQSWLQGPCLVSQQCWEGRFTPSWELYPCTLVLPGGFCSTANSFQLWIPPVTGGLGISAGHSAGGGDEPLLVVTRNISLGQIRIRLRTTTWKAGPLSSNWWVKIPDKPYEGDLGRPRKSVSDHICIPPSSMFYFWLQAVPVISKEIQL